MISPPVGAGGPAVESVRLQALRERRERAREAMRWRILRAALDLFAHQGFEGTAMREIASLCGLTEGALYHYFKSKRQMLDALWEIPPFYSLHSPAPSEELTVPGLLNIVDEMIESIAQQDALIRVMIRQALANDRLAVGLRNQTMAYWRQALTRQFETCLDEDAAAQVETLVMLVVGVTYSAQIDYGNEFPTVARGPEFRLTVHNLVRLALPFCRSGAA